MGVGCEKGRLLEVVWIGLWERCLLGRGRLSEDTRFLFCWPRWLNPFSTVGGRAGESIDLGPSELDLLSSVQL